VFQVLARRALLRYFLQEIESAREKRPSIFVSAPDGSRESPVEPSESLSYSSSNPRHLLALRPDIMFHFFSSHTPCGDASIFPKDPGNDDVKHMSDKRSASENVNESVGPDVKKRKFSDDDDDIHRTGAKCLKDETKQDPHLPGTAYHVVGAVRTKPGRGDRTLSVSCSDKLFRWHTIGVQVIIV
jgi:tRNA-specific adenosine deaminase 1